MRVENEDLERAVVYQFIDALSQVNFDQSLKFQSLRSPPEPDALVTIDGKPLYLEVAHIYGSKADAKVILGRTGRAAPSENQRRENRQVPLNRRIIDPLNLILSKKAEKEYVGTPVWLVIRSATILWSRSDFVQNWPCIVVPRESPFEAIWLLCGPRSDFGLLRLDGRIE